MSGEARSGKPGARGTGAPRLVLAAVAAASVLALAACDPTRRMDDITAVELSKPEVRHPIGFHARVETLDVEVPPDADGLSPNQHVDVYRFLRGYQREATGRLVLVVPAESRPVASMEKSLQGIQKHVADAGIDYRITRGTRTRSREVPAIRIAYRRPVAVPPPCDHWGVNVGRNEARIPYPNYGCATQHNLAIMVDNARDLKGPQPEDPRSGERRHVTWSGYVGKDSGGGGGGSGDADPAANKPALPGKK